MAISLQTQSQSFIKKKSRRISDNSPVGVIGYLKDAIRPVKRSELLFFTSQLSLMMEIDTPLNLALASLRDQTANQKFRKVIDGILNEIEEGRQLSEAMKKQPRVFDPVFISMIKAGEKGGFLREMLDRMVELQEKRQALINGLRTALTYPAVLCVVSILVVFYILVGVLPKFTSFFLGKEEILPVTTRFLMASSVVLKSYWWALIIIILTFAISFLYFKKTERGKKVIDYLVINFPFISRLASKIYTCRLLRTLGHLMDSHVPLLEALEVTRGTIGNRFFRQLIDLISAHVSEGGKFSQPFSGYPYALESVKQMVATGEEAGNLPKVMLRLAEFYDDEVERDLKILSSMIEPVALIVMGVVIGLIVSSVVLPLFRLAHVLN
jgi:type IV pilus assembly protein PilC